MKAVFVTFGIGCALFAGAQNQLGLRTSNFGGVNNLLLNPSSFHHGALQWDAHIISAGAFIHNEYAYVENTSVLGLINHNGPVLFRSAAPDAPPDDPSALYYNFYDQVGRFSSSANAFVTGPGFAAHAGRFSFGLFTNMRVAGAGNRLDPDLDYFSLDRWVEGETKEFTPFIVNGMAWGEVGLNLATTLKKRVRSELNAGVNVKYLMGLQGFYFRNRNNTSVTDIGDTSLIDGGPINYGFTSGGGINGHGAGLDIGVTYIKRKDRNKPYDWKLGVSIVDLGFVRFNQNAQRHQLDEGTIYEIDRTNLGGGTSVDQLADDLSLEALGDATQSQTGDDFTLLTPSALSVQFDYALTDRWFLNATANRRFNLHPLTVDRENFWSVSARYESKWFEFGVPVVLYDDQHLRMGTWIRLWGLTIGSDHINSLLLRQQQLNGSDIYVSLRINSLNNPFGGNKSGKRRGKSAENCYF